MLLIYQKKLDFEILLKHTFLILVLNEKEAEINKAHAKYDGEMKTAIEDSQKTIEATKYVITSSKTCGDKGIVQEIAKIKQDHQTELKSREESHSQLLSKYDEKCESWELEKQVSNFLVTAKKN